MGAVYEVVDTKTDSRRALKVMLPSIIEDRDLRSRFEREARVTGGIESDHIVRVSDAGIDESTSTPFLIMDLLRGEELAGMVRRRGALPPEEVVTYISQVAIALDKTHAAGIVHRDLKPENLFVTYRDDGSPCVKILDFGIAKIKAGGVKANSTLVLGTPLYMSPEQFQGEAELDGRTDIFALGHVAYALLSGEAYWNEDAAAFETIFQLIARLAAGVQEPPSARAARRRGVDLPPPFDAWFAIATAAQREGRFERATAAAAALGNALGGAAHRSSLTTYSGLPSEAHERAARDSRELATPPRPQDVSARTGSPPPDARLDLTGTTGSAVISSKIRGAPSLMGLAWLLGGGLVAGGLVTAVLLTDSTTSANQTPTSAPAPQPSFEGQPIPAPTLDVTPIIALSSQLDAVADAPAAPTSSLGPSASPQAPTTAARKPTQPVPRSSAGAVRSPPTPTGKRKHHGIY